MFQDLRKIINTLGGLDRNSARLPPEPARIYHERAYRSKGIVTRHFLLKPVIGIKQLLRHLRIYHRHGSAAIDQ